MMEFIENTVRVEEMGMSSYKLAVANYNVHEVNDTILKQMKLI